MKLNELNIMVVSFSCESLLILQAHCRDQMQNVIWNLWCAVLIRSIKVMNAEKAEKEVFNEEREV